MKRHCLLLMTWFLVSVAFAQNDKDKKTDKDKKSFDVNDFMSKMEELKAKEEASKTGGNTKTTPGKRASYGGNTNRIKESYDRLSEPDKEAVKNLPIPPATFRTAEQAQAFVDRMKGIDVSKMMNESASMPLKIHLVNYQAVYQKSTRTVQGAAKAKAEFQKNNPNINFGDATAKAYICKDDVVYLPLGDASFADEIVEANFGTGSIRFPEQNCLNAPDYVEFSDVRKNTGVYNLGLGGRLVVKFTNNALVDVQGADLYVFEMGQVEPTLLEISKDGKTWINVGTISGGVAEVDISKNAEPNEYYYYVRLTDLKTNSTVPGADVDAIATIGGAMRLNLNAAVLFDTGKSELKKEGIAAVKSLANQLTNVQKATFTIAGFTDDIGSDETNLKLSSARAESVSRVLQQELSSGRGFLFKTKGYGKQNPVVPNNSDENRQKNRRVEVIVSPF